VFVGSHSTCKCASSRSSGVRFVCKGNMLVWVFSSRSEIEVEK